MWVMISNISLLSIDGVKDVAQNRHACKMNNPKGAGEKEVREE